MPAPHWRVSELEYLDSSDASVLAFHSPYQQGKQGGVEIIHHDVRVATNGDVRIEAAPGQWGRQSKFIARQVDAAAGTVRATLAYNNLPYSLSLTPRGEGFVYALDLEAALPPELVGKAGLNLEIYPPNYVGKTWQLGGSHGVFPRQPNGPIVRGPDNNDEPCVMARGKCLVLAGEDPLRRLTIEAVEGGELMLLDGRQVASIGWFVVRSLVPSGKTGGALSWVITPGIVPNWRRTPVIGISQVGYHPAQQKRAIIELDRRETHIAHAKLVRLDGPREHVMQSGPVRHWGEFLRYQYGIFDFSDVRQEGLYFVEYEGQRAGPFRISPSVYADGVWQPTLEIFMPVQMCHVRVEQGTRVWHGACHLDDARQAPVAHEHFDGYHQSDATHTQFAPGDHVPHMDKGGWHDAGDYDLAAGSQAETTLYLALAQEEFAPAIDRTTVLPDKKLVVLDKPDGVPDIVQQVVHGVECMLGGYRASGRTFIGIIEANFKQYQHMGDAATITDNVVSDDDRYVFTDHVTSLEYKVAAALAASARVLRGHNAALADECLAAAQKAWDYEQAHEPETVWNCYVPGRPAHQEVLATAELLLTTGLEKYRQRLVELLPTITANIGDLGWIAARVVERVNDAGFTAAVAAALTEYSSTLSAEVAKNPYHIPFHVSIWGIGWGLQVHAVKMYYLASRRPELFSAEHVLAVVNYVLGCHPGSNVSFVSGVGWRSLTIAFGTSRADWSHIAGGVGAGTNYIAADFPECKEDSPFFWQQSEYVIHGATSYIFNVLAAERLLSKAPSV
jgi:hypothetical protein